MSGTREGRRGSRIRICSVAAVGAMFVALIGTAGAAWDGTQEVTLGDSFSSTFQSDPGEEIHNYLFYAPTGAKLKAKIKVDKDANLVPAWFIFDAAGDAVDLGNAFSGTKIKNFEFQTGGVYTMRVQAQSGLGRYSVSLGGSKLPAKYKQNGVEDEFSFEAVAGQKMTAKLKGGPTFDALLGPFGPVTIPPGSSSLKNLVLPWSGTYTFEWDGTAKKIDVKLKKPKKAAWFFDAVEATRGSNTLARDEWLTSGHADVTAEAFRHWDEDGEISTSCATCHSSFGYQDFVGADGTPSNVLGSPKNSTDNPAALGSTVDCDACHNSETPSLDTVQFPSGNIVDGLGPEARCMQCHQGRESTVSLDAEIADAAPADDDTEDPDLGFKNIHYYAAGASLYGHEAMGAYEYADKTYHRRFPHVSTVDACQECHNQHTLQLRSEDCASCHTESQNPGLHGTADWIYDIRQVGSLSDYDGDGDAEEGVFYELETMSEKLYAAMQQYATAMGNPIVYDSHAYPYFFNDTNGSGDVDPGEAIFPNAYNHWTARLLRAAYNYQYWQKDPGLFAHNAKYGIEFMYDSIASLNEHASVSVPGFDAMVRNDTGHFDHTAEAFRHWDEDPEVPARCARCHSNGGFAFYGEFGIDPTVGYPQSDGFSCEQCHPAEGFSNPDGTPNSDPPRYYVDQVTFPSGVQIKNDADNPDDSFLCMTCHQGRTSAADVDEEIAEGGTLGFQNIHYLAAGPSLYGADAEVGYQYPGKTYDGEWMHVGGASNQCNFCHLSDHSFLPKLSANCTTCHPEANGNIEGIRRNRDTDYDGDGDNTELLKDELQSFGDALLAAMHDYAVSNGLPDFVYTGSYPYFENVGGGRYSSFDGPLLRASFNYQMWHAEPGAWAHNTHYILQLLYDSTDDLQNAGNALSQDYLAGFTRP